MRKEVKLAPNTNLEFGFFAPPLELSKFEVAEAFWVEPDEALLEANLGPAFSEEGLRLYIHEVTQTPLLTKHDEKLLFTKVLLGSGVAADLGQSEEIEKVVEEAERARRYIFMANTRLVIGIASVFKNYSRAFMDLIQDGNIGLLEAIDGFDPHLGNRFSTYATYCIWGNIVYELARNGGSIRLPYGLARDVVKFKKTCGRLYQQNQREPSLDEVAADLGISHNKATTLYMWSRTPVSLDRLQEDPDDREDNRPVKRPQPIPFLLRPTENLALSRIVRQKSRLIFEERLSVGQQMVLEMRGLDPRFLEHQKKDGAEKQMPMAEIGERMGISRQRVAQIEETAQQSLLNSSFKDFFEELKE